MNTSNRTIALLALVLSKPEVPELRRVGLATCTEAEAKMYAWFYEASKYFDHSEEALAKDAELKAVFQISQKGLINLLVARFSAEIASDERLKRLL